MNSRDYLIALNMIEGLSSLNAVKLLKHYKNPADIFKAPHRELSLIANLNSKTAKRIPSFLNSKELTDEYRLIAKHNIEIITILDDNYPLLLRQITDPPIVLYLRGKLHKTDSLSLAVVGSRKSSQYGLKMSKKISFELAERGLTIVSGLARGIDTGAHQGALRAKGRTIAILGSGLCRIYPPENRELYEKIQLSGAVISEFALNQPPYRYNFPRRNRIISGLSLGVTVIEAREKSGSLITANMALEQGRDVFALPHRPGFPSSCGTNKLIKQGAVLIQDSEDIINELNPEIKKYLQCNRKSGTISQCADKLAKEKQSKEIQALICNLLNVNSMDKKELIKHVKEEDLLQDNLTSLEIKGLINKTEDGKYNKII
jgi:DNA processing protein